MGKPISFEDKPTLCHKCGVRAATNFICNGTKGESSALCDECLQAVEPSQASFAAQVKAARCRYCGGYPCSGGTDPLQLASGGPQEFRWMCMSCAMEYYQHVQKAFSGIAGMHLTAVKQVERMKETREDAEAHMREFVRMRDN